MASKSEIGSVKRFGTRYGRTVKLKMAAVEKTQRAKHKCPYCNYVKLRRVSLGIWQCEKCNAKFTARAYEPGMTSATE